MEDRRALAAEALPYIISPEWFQYSEAPHSDIATDLNESAAVVEPSNQWIVQFTAAATAELRSVVDSQRLLEGGYDFRIVGGLGRVGQVLISTAETNADLVAEWLRANPNVAYAEPNQNTVRIASVPNDRRFADLWGLDNTGETGGVAGAHIHALEAWELTTGSRDIVVGVNDTGVDYNHPDLAANMWVNPGEIPGNRIDDDGNGFIDDVHGYDFVNNDGDPMDDHDHGTHVAGTIGAMGNNHLGVVGVNWTSTIMALKSHGADGFGTHANVVRAVNYATMMRQRYGVNVRVTNNSYGSVEFNQATRDSIDASGNAGILFVAAAHNQEKNNDSVPHYPASYDLPNVISVAATDHRDQLASFSNYGAKSVHLAAPGVDVLSTVANNSYAFFGGTSMATPHVVGTAALAWAYAPESTVSQIRNAILDGAEPVPALDGRVATGGRLNARATLERLALSVIESTPGRSTPPTPPSVFKVSFTEAFEPLTLEASDFLVNDIVANSVVIQEGDNQTATFSFDTSPVAAEGPQTMRMLKGAVMRQSDASPLLAWQSLFYFDRLSTEVVSSEPEKGATLSARPSTIVLNFNEAIDPASVGVDDLELNFGTVSSATMISDNSVRYEVSGLVQDGFVSYALAGAVTDLRGNPAARYSGQFIVDDPLVHRFRSGDVPQSIADYSKVTSVIEIPSAVTIADVDVALDLAHTDNVDLRITLVGPDGTRVELFNNLGNRQAKFIGTVFDDESDVPIFSTAIFSGRFRPAGRLSALDGIVTAGPWTLEITDEAKGDIGRLEGWELIITQAADPAPRIIHVTPLPDDQAKTSRQLESVTVQFSEAMQPQTVNSANWELREAGPDELFDTADDKLYGIAPSPAYSGGFSVELAIAEGPLLPGRYRLTAARELADLAGNLLDGNADGKGGDAYVRYFSVVTVSADALEPNDSFSEAHDLGAIGSLTKEDLSIDVSENDDFYRFQPSLTGTLTADVLFNHADGDIDAALFNAGQSQLASSETHNGNERLIWYVVGGQTYYLRVNGHAGAVNPQYALQFLVTPGAVADRFEPNDSFSSATDLGSVGTVTVSSLSIHKPDDAVFTDADFYRFTAEMTGLVTADVLFSHAAGNLDCALFDAKRNFLTFAGSRDNDERIRWEVTEGQTYYLAVIGFNREAVSPNYTLRLAVAAGGDRFEPNDSFALATDLGVFENRIESNLSIQGPDFYRFTAAKSAPLRADLTFRHSDGDLDMVLYDADQSFLADSTSTADNERILHSVVAGQSYYLRVFGSEGSANANYSLTWNTGASGTPANDALYFKKTSDGRSIEVYDRFPPLPAGATPIYTWPMNATEPLVVNTYGGEDRIAIDLPQSSGPAGGFVIDTGTGANNQLLLIAGEFRADSVSTGGVLNTAVYPGARVSTSRLMQNSLTLRENSTVTLLPGGETSRVTGLTLVSGARFDMTDNALVVDYTGSSPLDHFRDQLLAGRGGPGLGKGWDGTGITSSTAAQANAEAPESRSIGYVDNAALPLGAYETFRGVPIDNTAILIAYTRTGDVNLDGVVNDDDVTIVGATYAPAVPQPGWALGDFDYNGFVDDDDVTLLGGLYDPAGTLPMPPPPSGSILPTVAGDSVGDGVPAFVKKSQVDLMMLRFGAAPGGDHFGPTARAIRLLGLHGLVDGEEWIDLLARSIVQRDSLHSESLTLQSAISFRRPPAASQIWSEIWSQADSALGRSLIVD